MIWIFIGLQVLFYSLNVAAASMFGQMGQLQGWKLMSHSIFWPRWVIPQAIDGERYKMPDMWLRWSALLFVGFVALDILLVTLWFYGAS